MDVYLLHMHSNSFRGLDYGQISNKPRIFRCGDYRKEALIRERRTATIKPLFH